MSEALDKLVKEFENAVDNAPYRVDIFEGKCCVFNGNVFIAAENTIDDAEEKMTYLNLRFIIKEMIKNLQYLNQTSNKSYPILIEEILSTNDK